MPDGRMPGSQDSYECGKGEVIISEYFYHAFTKMKVGKIFQRIFRY
jgi:hypothetical protein